MYVLRGLHSEEQIEVYDIDLYRYMHCLTVPGLGHNDAYDIVACGQNNCAYIFDLTHDSVHRVAVYRSAGDAPAVTQWPVNDRPALLSLTYTHGVLVSCWTVRKIKEFNGTNGQLLHVLTLQDVVTAWHTIQLSSGQFLVCAPGDPLYSVCVTSSDGSVVKSFGEPSGPSSQQMNLPFQMAVDRNGFVFVVHQHSHRVSLLSPRLTSVRDVVSRDDLSWLPTRVHLDSDRGRLYVADENRDGNLSAGRVVVVSV